MMKRRNRQLLVLTVISIILVQCGRNNSNKELNILALENNNESIIENYFVIEAKIDFRGKDSVYLIARDRTFLLFSKSMKTDTTYYYQNNISNYSIEIKKMTDPINNGFYEIHHFIDIDPGLIRMNDSMKIYGTRISHFFTFQDSIGIIGFRANYEYPFRTGSQIFPYIFKNKLEYGIQNFSICRPKY